MALPKGLTPIESAPTGLPKGLTPIKTGEVAEAPSQPSGSPIDNTLSYMLDQMKLEGGELASKILPNPLLRYMTGGRVDPMADMKADIEASGGVGQPIDPMRTRQQEFQQTADLASQITGYEGLQPQNELDRYLGIGARAVTDPLNIVGVGGKTAAGKLASFGWETVYGALTASGGALAGDVTREAAEDLGIGETGQQVSGDIAAILAGGGMNVSRAVTGSTIRGGLDIAKKLPGSGNKASDFLSSSEVQSVIGKAAAAEGGDLVTRVKAATDLMDEIPGLVIPTAAASGDNPIIRKNFSELYSKYPEFRAKYDKAQKLAVEKLREATTAITDTVDIKQRDLRKLVETHSAEEIAAHNKLYRKRAEAIENQLANLSTKLSSKTDASSIGVAAENLMRAKEDAVRASLSPQYDAAIKNAETNGYQLPPESVGTVYRTIKEMNALDIFASFPGLTKIVKEKWSPKSIEGYSYDAPGPAQKIIKKEFMPASVRDADSLKRAINKAMRGANDPTHLRVLGHLKDVVAGEMNKLPDDFVQAYRSTDMEFATRLGLPKSAEGVKALDRARFETSVGSQLSKFDQARDYLKMVGEDGVPIVRDALMLAAEKAGVVTPQGDVNPVALARFVKRNEPTIDLVPGLKDELYSAKDSADVILDTGKRIESEYNDTAKRYTEGFYKAIHNENLDAIAQRILTKPGKRREYLAEIKKMPPDTRKMAMTGVRQALLEKATGTGGSMADFIKGNREAFDDTFGKSYVNDLERVSRAYDILAAMESSKGGMTKDFKEEDFLKRSANVSVEEAVGTLRNQVMSAPRKAMHLGSKMFLRQSAIKRDKQLMDLMLDPRGIAELGTAAARVEAAARSGEAGKKLFDAANLFAKEFAQRALFLGVKGASQADQGFQALQEQQAVQASLQPTR